MGQSKQVQVLIVDDESAIRMNLAAFLEDESFEVLEAESAEQGLQILCSCCPDVSIVDLRLPGLDGCQFIKEAHHKHPEMKFFIHTGSHEFQLTDELKLIGLTAEDIWLKPIISMKQVVQAIQLSVGGIG